MGLLFSYGIKISLIPEIKSGEAQAVRQPAKLEKIGVSTMCVLSTEVGRR